MKQDNTRKLTYGAVMLAFFAVLLVITVYIPLIGMASLFFLPLPIIMYRLRYELAPSVFVVAAGILFSLLVGGIYVLPFALVFGIIGLLIGEMIRRGKTKLYAFMGTGVFLLLLGMAAYLVAVYFFNINFVDALLAQFDEAQKVLLDAAPASESLAANYKELVAGIFMLYRTAIPMIFIGGTFFFAYLLIIVNYPLLRRLGYQVPRFGPLREMRLPGIVVLIYGLFLLYSLLGNMDESSGMYVLYINATILLRFLFFLQGISLILYFMNKVRSPKILTALVVVIGICFTPITVLLGIFDSATHIRVLIDKDKTR